MTKKEPAPSDLADKFMLRMPDGMRDKIKAAAEANNRSMNAEIIARLLKSFSITTHGNVVLPAVISSKEIESEIPIAELLRKLQEKVSVIDTELKTLLDEKPYKD